MSQFKKFNIKDLIDNSKKQDDVLTIEATVITGFEGAAMDECREKCSPLMMCKAQGRIVFNVLSKDFEKVLKLRSVDNLFLVNDAFESIEFSKNKETDLELIKSLVQKVNWSTLKIWAELIKFEGILFPLESASVNDTRQVPPVHESNGNVHEVEVESEKHVHLDHAVDLEDQRTSDNCDLKSNEVPHGDLNGQLSKLVLEDSNAERLSESGDEVYCTADEDDQLTNSGKKVSKGRKAKVQPKSENSILKFRATCNRVGEHSFTSMEAAACFGGALNDEFQWTVDLTNFDLNAILNINKDVCYICSAITGKSMHRRNITHFGFVTLRSTMCYNLVRLAEPVKGEIIVDPLCGGGSIPIEGALGFPDTFHICGDNDEKAMKRTRANVDHLQKSEKSLKIDPLKWSAKKLPLRDSSIDVCVTDLPFGKRSGRKTDNLPLYRDVLSEIARVCRPGTARAVLLTHDKKSFTKALYGPNAELWRQVRTVSVNQGGLFSTVFLLLRTAKPFLKP